MQGLARVFRSAPRRHRKGFACLRVGALALAGCGQGPGGTGPGAASGAPDDAGSQPSLAEASTDIPLAQGLEAVWGTGATDVWAVGEGGTAVHFDGHAWALTDTGTTESLTSVHGTGPR